MEIKDISVDAWKQMLKSCTLPKPQTGKSSSGHRYVAIKGNDIALFDNVKEAASQNYRKLSLSEISDLSKRIIGNGTSPKDSAGIAKQVRKLADAKDSKLNSFSKLIGRFALKCLKVISYVSLIGIPLGSKINSWENSIASHQDDIIKTRQFAVLSNKQNRTDAYMDRVSEILNAESKKTDAICGVLEGSLADSMKRTPAGSSTLVQFENDHKRGGTALTLIDGDHHYKGKSLKIGENADRHFQDELKQVNKLVVKHETDLKWHKLIQAACTQTTGNSALYGLKTHALDAGISSGCIWSDHLGDYRYQIQEKHIPIELRVIRKGNGEIEKLAVKSSIPTKVYQIREAMLPGSGAKQYEVANAIAAVQSTIDYELKLDEKGEPKVSNLHVNLELKK